LKRRLWVERFDWSVPFFPFSLSFSLESQDSGCHGFFGGGGGGGGQIYFWTRNADHGFLLIIVKEKGDKGPFATKVRSSTK